MNYGWDEVVNVCNWQTFFQSFKSRENFWILFSIEDFKNENSSQGLRRRRLEIPVSIPILTRKRLNWQSTLPQSETRSYFNLVISSYKYFEVSFKSSIRLQTLGTRVSKSQTGWREVKSGRTEFSEAIFIYINCWSIRGNLVFERCLKVILDHRRLIYRSYV